MREAALDAILTHGGEGADVEIPFRPRRILMHDTTCGPALVDIAAMRDVIAENGGDPASLSPICPVATSTDHSVGVDRFRHRRTPSLRTWRSRSAATPSATAS